MCARSILLRRTAPTADSATDSHEATQRRPLPLSRGAGGAGWLGGVRCAGWVPHGLTTVFAILPGGCRVACLMGASKTACRMAAGWVAGRRQRGSGYGPGRPAGYRSPPCEGLLCTVVVGLFGGRPLLLPRPWCTTRGTGGGGAPRWRRVARDRHEADEDGSSCTRWHRRMLRPERATESTGRAAHLRLETETGCSGACQPTSRLGWFRNRFHNSAEPPSQSSCQSPRFRRS